MWKESGLNLLLGKPKKVQKKIFLKQWFWFQRLTKNVCFYLSIRWRPKIDNLMDRLAVTMSRQNELKKAPAKTTEPKEFSLTKPKTPAVPLPELIPLQEKWKPVSPIICPTFPFKQCYSICMCAVFFLSRSAIRETAFGWFISVFSGCNSLKAFV